MDKVEVDYSLLTSGSSKLSSLQGTEKNTKNIISDIQEELTEISNMHNNCLTSLSSIDSLTTSIEDSIESIVTLSEKMQQTIEIYKRTEELLCNIAADSFQAKDGKFYARSAVLGKYWGDSSGLEFTYNEATGTYLISEGGVAMGFTTASALASYLGIAESDLKKSDGTIIEKWSTDDMKLPTEQKNNTTTTNDTEKENTSKHQLRQSTTPRKVSATEVSKSVNKEILDYAKIETDITKSDYEKTKAYNSLSEEAKSFVDGEKVVRSLDNSTMEEMVDARDPIHVAKGKHIYINGDRILGTDITFYYDNETGLYRTKTSAGNYAYGGYELIDMSKAQIK